MLSHTRESNIKFDECKVLVSRSWVGIAWRCLRELQKRVPLGELGVNPLGRYGCQHLLQQTLTCRPQRFKVIVREILFRRFCQTLKPAGEAAQLTEVTEVTVRCSDLPEDAVDHVNLCGAVSKQWLSCGHLNEHAAQTPNVDFVCEVGTPKADLRRTIPERNFLLVAHVNVLILAAVCSEAWTVDH